MEPKIITQNLPRTHKNVSFKKLSVEKNVEFVANQHQIFAGSLGYSGTFRTFPLRQNQCLSFT